MVWNISYCIPETLTPDKTNCLNKVPKTFSNLFAMSENVIKVYSKNFKTILRQKLDPIFFTTKNLCWSLDISGSQRFRKNGGTILLEKAIATKTLF